MLKRFYFCNEINAKLSMLTEYFKYHEDVPRLFMTRIAQTVHNFYDKKRRINYIRITRMLKGKVEEKIKIHDSESITLSKQSVGSSLAQMLPSEFRTAPARRTSHK